jgi:hypothetical protein
MVLKVEKRKSVKTFDKLFGALPELDSTELLEDRKHEHF